MFRQLIRRFQQGKFSLDRILKKNREAAALSKKSENLKSVFITGRSTAEKKPDVLYREMIYKVSVLLGSEDIYILTLGAGKREYTCSTLNDGTTPVLKIGVHEEILNQLSTGKHYTLSAGSLITPETGSARLSLPCHFFPVIVYKKLEAILSIHGQHLEERKTDLIAGFCRQVSLAIENQYLYRELQTKFNRFEAIADVTKAITPIQNDKELLRIILDKSAELLKAEQGSLMVFDLETDMLLLQAKKGVVDGVNEKLRISRGQGISGKVVDLGEPILVQDVESDPRTMQKNRHNYKTTSFISVPIKIDDRIIGVLNLADKNGGESFTEEDLKLTQALATQAAVVMERNVFYNKNEELKKLSITDTLTGLLNRRYLYQRLTDEMARSKRDNLEFSLLLVDLDRFKNCNDTLGHLFGDQTLILVAETLLTSVRSMDVVARFGGDEFVIVLPEAGESKAKEIAERIRSTLEKKLQLYLQPTGAECNISASIGIVSFPKHGDSIEPLLSSADKALYMAKNNGKNRVEVLL